MTLSAARIARRWVSAVTLLSFSACTSLLGFPPAPHLYRVAPTRTYPANLPHLPAQILIDVPLAPAGLDSPRIALSRSAVSIDYFADSEWTERVPLLVQTALLESFENSGTIAAIDRESIGLRADFILKTEIRHFEAVYDAPNAAPEAWVALEVRLINPAGRDIVAHNSFERRERATANDITPIVVAFDQAIGAVMADIIAWTARNPALSTRRRQL